MLGATQVHTSGFSPSTSVVAPRGVGSTHAWGQRLPLPVFNASVHRESSANRPKQEAPMKEVKERQKSRIDVATHLWLCRYLDRDPHVFRGHKTLKRPANLPLHAPTFTLESQEMAVCCEDTDSTGMLIGLLIALVIAMLFFVICQPHPPRRFTVYRCY